MPDRPLREISRALATSISPSLPGLMKVMSPWTDTSFSLWLLEAKAKAEELLKQIKGGADFVKLVKENSGDPTSAAKDGDFGTIHKTDRLPDPVKTAIFATQAGQVTDPVRQPNGYYLFKVVEIGPPAFEQVKEQVGNDLKNAKFSEWLQSVEKSLDIQMKDTPAPSITGEVLQPGAKSPAPTLQK